MNRIFLWTCMIFLVSNSACNPKDYQSPPEALYLGGELKADPSFTWSTTREVNIEVTGMQLPISVSRKLTLSTEEGDVFYAGTQKMSEDFFFDIELPSHIHTITMEYGDIVKVQDIEGSKIAFDYLAPANENGFVE